MRKRKAPRFDVHPSVVYQLGEGLITDAVQAIIELVKNCYDADATYAKVIIDTTGSVEVPGSIYPATGGRIVVEDDGCGMDMEAIDSGWLLIANSKKRDLKQAKKTTPGGRTPLGDKGLGRLGVQRLGENLEFFTKCAKEPGYHIGFSWLDFATAPRLQDVEVHLQEHEHGSPHGTRVVVSNLREIGTWRGQASIKKLEQELSRMISPYKAIRDFTVLVEVNGKALELVEVSDAVREIAPIRYTVGFDGKSFTLAGKARLDFFRPSTPKDAEEFALIAESDNGDAFFRFLAQHKMAKAIHLTRSRPQQWFVEFGRTRPLEDIDGLDRDQLSGGEPFNPGPFTAEVDSFDLGTAAFKHQSVFDRISEYRAHIKNLSGIRVYRDGFAIRVDHDWLKLGAQWTSAISYYGLKPDNTLGYVALSARDNIDLEETTDREGFKDSPHYRNFYALLMEFKNFTTDAHNFFGRSWAEFRRTRTEILARVDSRKTVEELSGAIRRGMSDAASHRKALASFQTRFEASVKEARSAAQNLKTATTVTPRLRDQVSATLSALEPLVAEAQNVLPAIAEKLAELGSLAGMGQVLEDRVESLRSQMDDMYETVALGLTAEALSHEIFNIADHLARRAKTADAKLRKKGISDRVILAFVEYVRSSVAMLRKQVSFLSPSLRYIREKKEVVNVAAFLRDLREFYVARLKKNSIAMVIKADPHAAPLRLKINRGKLTQIFDNFLLNSEYWLKDDIAGKRIEAGKILFSVSAPFVHISDNGRGIDPSVEHTLFEPFISAKGRGQGRGLGLFIVKQLLDSEGCSVGLTPKRNRRKRLHRFQIDFRGAMHD